MKKLSVIVPIYNSEQYLKECLDSICNQVYKNIQIILVNDGSTDNSASICDEYSKSYEHIKVIHQNNSGCVMARYKGVLASNSEYVTFVDSDDYIDSDAYQLFAEQMEQEIDIIKFGKIVEKNPGRSYPSSIYPYGKYNREEIEKTIYPSMLWDFKSKSSGLSHSLCDKIFKRDIILRSYKLFKSIPKIYWGEDAMILFPMMQWVNNMYISEKCPYHYRQNLNMALSYKNEGDFIENVYFWYKHIVDHTKGIPNFAKQIEYAFMNALESRKDFWGDFVHNDDYFVPFNKIAVHSRIVLYGAGKQGMTYFDQIKRCDFCEIVAWVDVNYLRFKEYGVKPIDVLKTELQYDYIVIAIQSEAIRNEVIKTLNGFGINNEKII